jgi:hypothetical protein
MGSGMGSSKESDKFHHILSLQMNKVESMVTNFHFH